MSEETAQEMPQANEAPVPSVEPEMPESFNIFADEASPVIAESSTPASEEPREDRKGQAFLQKMQLDKERRSHEIAMKQRETALEAKTNEIQKQIASLQTMKTNPNEFLKSQGIDPLDFQRKLAEHALHGGPTPEDRLDQTQMELAKLKQAIAQKEKQQERGQLLHQQKVAVQNFVSAIDSYGKQNPERYQLVKEQMKPSDIAEGMAAYYKETGEQITIEAAYQRLEAGLKQHEEKFYSDPSVQQKFQRYSQGAQKSVRRPQATMSSGWNEQPTRTSPEDMTYEQIREHWKGKLFT